MSWHICLPFNTQKQKKEEEKTCQMTRKRAKSLMRDLSFLRTKKNTPREIYHLSHILAKLGNKTFEDAQL